MSKKETAAAAPAAKMNGKQRKAAEKEAKAKSAAAVEAKAKATEPAAETATAAVKEAKVTSGGLPKLPPLPKMSSGNRERKAKPMHDCTCGCGGQTTGAWVPGHDARARGWAIRIERELITMKDVPENERAGAKHFLKLRKEAGETGQIKLAKGKATEATAAVEGESTGEEGEGDAEIEAQVSAAIADGMSAEAAEGLRASLIAARDGEAVGQ